MRWSRAQRCAPRCRAGARSQQRHCPEIRGISLGRRHAQPPAPKVPVRLHSGQRQSGRSSACRRGPAGARFSPGDAAGGAGGPAGLQARLGQRIVAHDRRLLHAAQAEQQHGDEPGAVLAVHAVHQDREVGGLREQPQRGRDWRVRLRARPRLAAHASSLRVNSGVRCRRASGQRRRRANLPRGLLPRSQQGGRCRCRKRRPERPGASRGAGRRTAGWTRISAISLEARAAEWSG